MVSRKVRKGAKFAKVFLACFAPWRALRETSRSNVGCLNLESLLDTGIYSLPSRRNPDYEKPKGQHFVSEAHGGGCVDDRGGHHAQLHAQHFERTRSLEDHARL